MTFCKQCSARRKVENFSATFVKRQVKIEVMLKNMQKLTLKASNTHVSNVTMFAAAGLPWGFIWKLTEFEFYHFMIWPRWNVVAFADSFVDIRAALGAGIALDLKGSKNGPFVLTTQSACIIYKSFTFCLWATFMKKHKSIAMLWVDTSVWLQIKLSELEYMRNINSSPFSSNLLHSNWSAVDTF